MLPVGKSVNSTWLHPVTFYLTSYFRSEMLGAFLGEQAHFKMNICTLNRLLCLLIVALVSDWLFQIVNSFFSISPEFCFCMIVLYPEVYFMVNIFIEIFLPILTGSIGIIFQLKIYFSMQTLR